MTQLNFGLTVAALIALATNKLVTVFWYLVPFTAGHEVIPRLKLFELEASHYSLAIMPLFFYYFWKVIQQGGRSRTDLLLLLSIILSLLCSFSLGVLAVIGIATILVIVLHLRSFLGHKNLRNTLLVLSSSAVVGIVLLLIFYPDNPLFYRINNLINGLDTSGRGRTYEAFEIASMVLDSNNPYFGIGLGQFKLIGRDALAYYYQFANVPDVARLPNCMAETLVTYGYVGVVLKIGLQIFLFFRMNVFRNVFQLSIFVALYFYQFTGSYLSNSTEYILWIMAFSPKLVFFNKSNYFNC